ncbi:cell wall-binding repeat-containing protein [Schumannella luteola]|jgi:putative cell wall-binding protein
MRLHAALGLSLLIVVGAVPVAASAADTAAISGTVILPDGSPVGSLEVIALDLATGEDYHFQDESTTGGAFQLSGLPAGSYRVRFFHSADLEGYAGEEPWLPQGVPVVLAEGESTTINYQLRERTSLTGTLSCAICGSSDYQYAHPFFSIQAQRPDGSWGATRVNTFFPFPVDPNFSFASLLPGTYRVGSAFERELSGPWGWGYSPAVTLVAGDPGVLNFSITLPPAGTTRLSGPDRFATAVAIAGQFPASDTVFIANGLNFPDALGAAPVAALAGSPLLLVTPDSIPASVMGELTRRDPAHIVIFGGTPSVSTSVETALSTFGDVRRIQGADRFATSIETARFGFPDGADIMYVANGLNFPDALSAGPAAASWNAPVVIVNGPASSAPSALRTLIEDLGVEEVRLVGSEASVSAGMAASIESWGVTVQRYAGADRYETSWYVNSSGNFSDSTPARAFIASGTTFPDALSGGALAGMEGVPLLISLPSCTTSSTRSALIYGLNPEKVTLLGSTASLAAPATLFTRC